MKLKFRADKKDIIIFVIFAIFLLYLVAIAVLNAYEFLDTGLLWGFDPFPAFTAEFIAPTMVFYLAALIAIIASVSSYFFDREKGIGVKASKKDEKGYSRWCEEKEMKKQLKKVDPRADVSEYAGIPLINNGKEIWVDAGGYHNLIMGSTGAGKTQIIVQPMVRVLAKKGESMIITDPKGEIYEKNAEMLRQKGYNVVLLNFRDPQKGSAWNPMNLPYSLYKEGNSDKANELLDDLAMNILYDEKAQSNDPFWEKTSADYFTGLSLGIFEDAKEDEINLNTINLMTTAGEEKFMGTTYIKDYFSYKSQSSPAYVNVASTLMAPSDTKSSILSVFKQKIKLFSSRENLSEMLSHNDFDMKDIGRKKTAVFIVIQDEKKTYHSLVTIFIKQCYETLIDVAQESGGKLPYKTNFILDEFANMPPLKDVTTMVSAARSRNIRFTFIIQNFAQLYQVYGKDNGETIKGNCGNIIYLISSELASLEEVSKLCGEVKSKEKDKTASTPLVTVSDLQRFPEGTVVVLRIRSYPFKTFMKHDWMMEKEGRWGKAYPAATYPQREKQEVKLFDIKKFCETKRAEKMQASGFPADAAGMFGGQAGFNPFQAMVNPNNSFNPMTRPENNGGMNIDDLVKRIDAKIAELEEEEKQEKKDNNPKPIEDIVNEKLSKKEEKTVIEQPVKEKEKVEKTIIEEEPVNMPTTPIMNDDVIPESDQKLIDQFILDNEQSEIIEKPKQNEIIAKEVQTDNQADTYKNVVESNEEEYNDIDITDDQFFDDFFSDDE